jgi:hypothetical protein
MVQRPVAQCVDVWQQQQQQQQLAQCELQSNHCALPKGSSSDLHFIKGWRLVVLPCGCPPRLILSHYRFIMRAKTFGGLTSLHSMTCKIDSADICGSWLTAAVTVGYLWPHACNRFRL